MSVQKVSKTYLQSQVFKVPRRQCWCLGSSLALVCCCPTGLCKSSLGDWRSRFCPFRLGHTPHLSTIDESPASWGRKKVPSKLATIASNWWLVHQPIWKICASHIGSYPHDLWGENSKKSLKPPDRVMLSHALMIFHLSQKCSNSGPISAQIFQQQCSARLDLIQGTQWVDDSHSGSAASIVNTRWAFTAQAIQTRVF